MLGTRVEPVEEASYEVDVKGDKIVSRATKPRMKKSNPLIRGLRPNTEETLLYQGLVIVLRFL